MAIFNHHFAYYNCFNQSIFAYCYRNDYNNQFSQLKFAKLIAINYYDDYDKTITTERRALISSTFYAPLFRTKDFCLHTFLGAKKALLYKKRMRKMLMKLTHGRPCE